MAEGMKRCERRRLNTTKEERLTAMVGEWLRVAFALVLVAGSVAGQGCDDRGRSRCYDEENKPQRCIPEFVNAAFNILVEATNTCGLRDSPTEYCVQTGVTGALKSCEHCDARYPKLAHGPEFLTDFNNNDNLTRWQSETMLEKVQFPNQVNLTLRLRKAFDITYVRLMFYSSRPESFAIYKRTSDDVEWIPYQYYSATCRDTYGLPDNAYVLPDDEKRALCTTEYSDISPLTGGNVAFSTLEGRPSANNFENSPELQDWVTATDIRITLDRLNTFGDEVFGDPKVLKSYFYAISDFAVGGRCKCNGHASRCDRDIEGRLACCCEHNTDGHDCNKCLPFYNDRPWGRATGTDAHECQPCNCNGRSNRCEFDSKLYQETGHGGRCVNCSGNTDGPNCERCRQNFYQRSDGTCVTCNCNEIGSQSQQCNQLGRCQCKPGVTGEKCDRCEANHYEFSVQGCRPCGCSVAGSLGNSPNCDPTEGICQCKENVEGRRCDSCKLGFFNLDQDHEFGCTPCFCFGHSSQCRSAQGYFKGAIESAFTRDAEQWTARDHQGQRMDMQYNANARNIAVSAPGRETVYFFAPRQYLGDQRASYNQHLSFTFRINQDGPRATVEDIVLEGVGQSIYQPIFGQGNPLPTTGNQKYSFRLHEHQKYGWSPRLNAYDFISVLSNLTAIKIRATYTHGGAGFLDNVELESTQRGGAGHEARWVEVCTCDVGYLGQFCESCNPGFHHDPPGKNPFARCVPCNCHGHADICDDTTGRCMCRHNTAGEHCERCARGYYGNALTGSSQDCKPCPCPNQGSCVDLGNNEVACLECPQGYGGHRCDVCTDGYYGDPSGRYGHARICQKCDCNTNVDPNAVGNCNRTTGECLKCIHNTAGPHCERCLPGFHGDALAIPKGDCKACHCNTHGSQRRGRGPAFCDSVTGQCECQQHVRGQRCDVCADGYWNLATGTGCEQCNCDPVGSKNQTCDIRTGQCFCQPGVQGRHCDECRPHHFAFSYDGCKECECDPIGSASLQCDLLSGQCQCRNNVEGRRCDRCKENKYDKQAGCVDCPPCYNLVQDAVNDHRAKLRELSELLDSIDKNPQLINDLDFEEKLRDVTRRVARLLSDAENAGGEDKSLIKKLKDLHERMKAVQTTSGKIADKVAIADVGSKQGVRNITEAEDIIRRAREALKAVQRNVDDDGNAALEKAKERSEKFGQQSNRMSEIAREASHAADEQEKAAGDIDTMAKRALNTSEEAYRIASEALTQQRATGDDIDKLKRDVQDANDLMERTKRLSADALNEASVAYEDALGIYTDAQGLLLPEVDAEKMKETADEIKTEAKKIQEAADDLMQQNKGPLDDLQEQMEEAEKQLANGEEQQQTADYLLADVDAALDTANRAVELGEKTLEEANKTLATLKGFDRLVLQSKEKADEAINKVPYITKLIEKAEGKTREAHGSLSGAENDANDARDIALEAQKIAEKASEDANAIRHEADETKERAGGLKDEADGLKREVEEADNRLKSLEDQAEQDRNSAKQALGKANEAKADAQQSKSKVKDALNTVNDILDVLSKVGDVDTDQLRELERKLLAAEKKLAEANLDKRMGELRAARTLQNQWMRDYEEELEKLRKDVDNVRSIWDSLPDKCYRRIKLEPEP